MSLTKIGSIGINTGIQLAGVTTVATLHVGSGVTLSSDGDIFATGISTFSEDIKVGSGVTISPDGDGFYTGVVTATTFSGSLAASNLTGALPAISGASLTGIDTDLVSDTSPQLGGNLDVNTKNITFGDSGSASDDRLTFGAGTDLSIYHDGSHSYISEQGTGNLRLLTSSVFTVNNAANSQNMILATDGGSVELYHAGNKKFETASGGVSVTGGINLTTNLSLLDSGYLKLGTGDDLQLYHDGSNSYIKDTGTGVLVVNSNQMHFNNAANDENMIKATENGAVELYHNNIKKLQTSTTDGVILGNTTDDANYTNTLTLTRRGYENSGYGVRIQAKGGSASGQNGLRFAISDGGGSTYDSRFSFTNDGLLFNSDTAAANALDDYEEGTFTPTIYYQNSSGLTIGTNSASGKYTKIGRIVWIVGYINWSVSGSPINDNVAIQGLPFDTSTGQIAAGGTRFVGNISLEGTSNESTTHQLEPYGTNGVNIITDDEKGNKSNELGGNSNMHAKYQFWYHTS